MPEFRVYNADGGYFRLHMMSADALRAAVELRASGLGLTIHEDSPIITHKIAEYDAIETKMDECGLCQKRFKQLKTAYKPATIPEKAVKELKNSGGNTITLEDYLTKIAGWM